MWPQTSLEELRAAQERADAGNIDYPWQIDSELGWQSAQEHPGHAEIFPRFLEEKLGWEAFLWHEAAAHPDGVESGDVVYIRCAPGMTNALYPTDPEASACAPTIDEHRYETVKIAVAQPHRQGSSGLWVVTGWEMIEPFEQVTPPPDADVTASLGAFLQARIDGAGAEDLAGFSELADERVGREIPLLYATSTPAPYERSEFELVDGPLWPDGRMRFRVRLFAENGETVVEQFFWLVRDATGRLRLEYDPQPMGPGDRIAATTENGTALPVEYGFLDGRVTYRAAFPLEPSLEYGVVDGLAIEGILPDDDFPRRVLYMFADPRLAGPSCMATPAPADAEALARTIRSDPVFGATAPVAVTIGGTSALQLDAALAAGVCGADEHPALVAGGSDRARLYLIDVPGGSGRVLALAIFADEDSFETVLEWATPIVDSIEFHAR
jgi:hypothetical protein